MSTHDASHWNQNLETGDFHVDLQHQELFQLVTSLDIAIRDQDMGQIKAIIVFLERYVIDHFDAEETIMKKVSFDGYDYHKAEHDMFEDMVHEMRRMLDTSPARTHLIFAIRKFIDRLVIHIRTVDIRIADIVHSCDHDTAESP